MPLLKVLRMCCCQNTNVVSVQEDRMTELQGDEKVWQHVQVSPSVLSPFNGQFPGEPGLAGVYWSKGWWRWWWQLDYWNYKSWKAPVKSSPPTNQHAMFYRLDALPVTQPTVSKHWKEKYHIPWTCLPQAHLGVFQLCLWPLVAPGYLEESCQLPCLSSALWCQYPTLSPTAMDRYT